MLSHAASMLRIKRVIAKQQSAAEKAFKDSRIKNTSVKQAFMAGFAEGVVWEDEQQQKTVRKNKKGLQKWGRQAIDSGKIVKGQNENIRLHI
jgi:hypothetical protein